MTSAQHRELQLVNEELSKVEEELEELLGRQHKLMKRKKVLEQRLSQPEKMPSTDTKEWERTDFKWSAQLEYLKSSIFRVKEFRPLQMQAINATLSNRDCIVVMPTGGGKSLCYQLPSLVSKGLTLVVCPLVSLMEDQLMSLKRLGMPAALLSASSSKEEVKQVQDAMADGRKVDGLRLLYVTPEKLAKSKRFMNKLEKAYELGLLVRIAIDEVHCCSQWGHDFRPDYKFLGVLKRQFPNVPIMGLTATATSDVIDDVMKMLGIPGSLVFRAPLNRPNLFYEVHPKASSLALAVKSISEEIEARFKGQSGIIYCLTQKDAEEVTREMQTRSFRVGCYHANIDAKHRSRVHSLWTMNEIQVIVATIAFGMGIDKPDVRFVIHHSVSKSVENYYQESGRAGRDGGPAYCILYFNIADLFRQSTMVFTEQTGLEKLYAMMHYAVDLTTCRRSLLAQHFGETWESKHCQEMCDHCSPQFKANSVMKDVTQYCKDVLTLLSHAKATKQRVTSLKLVEAWTGKGNPALRVSSVAAPKIPRSEVERMLVHMLLNGYLKEDFHFTPYSTISYILPGGRSSQLQSPGHCIEVDLLVSEASSRSPWLKSKTSSVLNCIKPQGSSGKNTSSETPKNPKDCRGVKRTQPEAKKTERKPDNTTLLRTKRIRIESDDDVFQNGDATTTSTKTLGMSSKSAVVIDDDHDDDDETDEDGG